jgi:hypothetical protein
MFEGCAQLGARRNAQGSKRIQESQPRFPNIPKCYDLFFHITIGCRYMRSTSRPKYAHVLGIGRIEPVLGHGHQELPVGSAFSENFVRQSYTGGKARRKMRNPWEMKNRFRKCRIKGNLNRTVYSERRDAGPNSIGTLTTSFLKA